MSVRAKFTVSMVDEKNKAVYLAPVTSGSDENAEFYKWTPGGHILLQTVNEDALAQFANGKEFYVDFTSATEEESGKRRAMHS